MTDASTTQLVTVALVSAVGGGGIAGLIKLGEFRREDRARWVTERRELYAELINTTSRLVVVSGIADLLLEKNPDSAVGKEQVDAAIALCRDMQPTIATLRLLAPEFVRQHVLRLEFLMDQLRGEYFKHVAKLRPDTDRTKQLVTEMRSTLETLTAAARRDLRA